MKSCIIFSIILLFSVNNVFSQTGTFDFETATTSGSPTQVSQTVDSRTITVSSSVDFHALDPFIEWSFSVNGISGKTAVNDIDMTQNITISFSGPVNITTLKVYEGTASNSPGTMTFVPTGGSNSTVNFTPSPNQWDSNSKLVTLNWIGITAINITTPYTYYWGFDDIVMDATFPVELTSFTATPKFNQVSLNWQTATEVNNYGFEIERRNPNQIHNDNAWRKIGFVAGAGNSNSPKEYALTDQPVGGTDFFYRLKQIDNNGDYKYYDAVSVKLDPSNKMQLLQNNPNPFNPTTAIKFYIPDYSEVTIKIYDLLGREVTTLLNQQTEAGYHTVYWNGQDRFGNSVASGVYLYRLTAGTFTETKKMNLLR